MDETNLSTVPKSRHKIIAAKGKRQVGPLSRAKKNVTTTGVFCMNAAGYFLPPMLIFKRKRMKDELKDGALPETPNPLKHSKPLNQHPMVDAFLEVFK